MVALLSHVVHSFRSLLSLLPPNFHLKTSLAASGHHWDIPLPPILHQTLTKEFIDRFEEVVVIGDVHGCYDELIQLLDQIHTIKSAGDNSDTNNNQKNANNDRILKLFVGDLVNKGPKNSQVLDYLIQNCNTCLSVRGNHDEVVIKEYLKYRKDGESALKPQNLWMKGLSQNQMDYLIGMPYTISVPTLNALVVHAGVVPNRELTDQSAHDMTHIRNVFTDDDNKLCATAKDTVGEEWVSRWSGPQHIYFGHDAKRKLQRTQFATGLDTGCVYGNSLTAIFIYGQRTGNLVSVKANAVHCPPKIQPTPPPRPQ